ncbi:MAG: hypothetical protein O3C69_05925, partial [Chloroflexi bacterium]|nr:hypothetical protein [Chloroflexota bacterium]
SAKSQQGLRRLTLFTHLLTEPLGSVAPPAMPSVWDEYTVEWLAPGEATAGLRHQMSWVRSRLVVATARKDNLTEP